MASEWFYKLDGKAVGPVTPAKIKALAAEGTIGPNSLIRKAESDGWTKAARIKGLFPEPVDEAPQEDPLIAMGKNAAASMASAAGSAVNAVGALFAKKESPDVEVVDDVEIDSPWDRLTKDGQALDVVDKLMARLSPILMTEEIVRYVAIQAKPMVIAQDCIVITNKRFIFYRQRLLGRADFEDYVWRELRDAQITENLIGATVTVEAANGRTLSMDYLPRAQARQVYRMAQEMEEKSLEERRSRALEEKRAAAGSIVVNASVPHPQPQAAAAAEDPLAKLKSLKAMMDAGLITSAEFEAKKAEILSRM